MTQNVLRLALSALLMALSVPAAAQQPQNIPRIGYLTTHPADMELRPFFLQGLRELAAELVRLKVDVIVVSAGENDRLVMKEAITTIPFVFIESADPVRLGLVESLARPGGNATGQSNFHGHLAAKRLELLKEVVPAASRIAFLWMSGSIGAPLQLQDIQAAASGLGVTLLAFAVDGPDDVDRALTALAQERPEALVVHGTVLGTPHGRSRVFEFAVQHRLPAIYTGGRTVEAGGLMSYGAHFPDLYRRAATYVHKILQGTKPADIPVEQPMRFELVTNVHTAQQMGLTIPPSVLYQADRVIK